nr:cell wall hydrolase [uncultured Roseburia sp.]
MNRKILDVTMLCTLCICLMVAANIEEKNTIRESREEISSAYVISAADGTEVPVAGVCSVLSGYSFTTESDEATGITKNPRTMVASAAPSDAAQEVQAASGEAEAPEAAESKPATVETTTGAENRWNITLTQEEIDLLAKIVWLESQGEPTEGQEAVVEVVFNRMASEKYPDTLYDVLSQGNPTQFCSWKNRERANPTEKEYTSIHEVLNGNTHILRNDTLYFSTEPLTPRLDQKIGGHSFCY